MLASSYLKHFISYSIVVFFLHSHGAMAESISTLPITELLGKLEQRYQTIESYSATMTLENWDTGYQLQQQRMWFKKPGYLLLEQLGPFKPGARLSIHPDGKIRGHLGGWLRFVVVSLERDDENVFGVTHDPAYHTDFGKIIEIAYSMVDRVKRFEIKNSTLEGKPVILLDTFYNGEIDHLRLIIDSEMLMIVGLERFKNNKRIHRIVWKDIKTNIELKNELFDL